MDFYKYLTSRRWKEAKQDGSHSGLVDAVVSNVPLVLGISPDSSSIFQTFREVGIFGSDGKTLASLDLVLYSPAQVVLIEAKVSHGRSSRDIRHGINKQLRRGYDAVQSRFNFAPRLVGVYLPLMLINFCYYNLSPSGEEIEFGRSSIKFCDVPLNFRVTKRALN